MRPWRRRWPRSNGSWSGAKGKLLRVSDDVYRKIAVREGADGVLGVFATPDCSVERLKLPAEALVLAASGVEKPGNVGALLRTADAFGVDALLVEGGTDLFNPNVVRASVGCLFTVPVAEVPAGGLLSYLREQRFRVVAASPEGGADARPHRLLRPRGDSRGQRRPGPRAGRHLGGGGARAHSRCAARRTR